MLKAFCPVITMLLLFAARLERPTPRLIASILLISLGVSMASYGEMNMSFVSTDRGCMDAQQDCVHFVLQGYVRWSTVHGCLSGMKERQTAPLWGVGFGLGSSAECDAWPLQHHFTGCVFLA